MLYSNAPGHSIDTDGELGKATTKGYLSKRGVKRELKDPMNN